MNHRDELPTSGVRDASTEEPRSERRAPGHPSGPSEGAPSSLGLVSVDGEAADAALELELLEAALVPGAPQPKIARFVLERRLGSGATSAVYRAWDPLLARAVALKLLFTPQGALTDRWAARAIREARALAHLAHGNVVRLYEFGQWSGRIFLVMELVEGQTLGAWLAARSRSTAELCGVFADAAQGLAAAHACGLVHRDVKPSNVLVADDGRVLVSDFGLVGIYLDSAQIDGDGDGADASRAGSAVGTPAYAAPEQQGGALPHPAADVYSFAVMFVEALLGVHPLTPDGARWRSRLQARLPLQVRDAVIEEVIEAVIEALEPEVSARAASLERLLAALSAARVSDRARAPRRAPRAPRRALVAGGALTAAALGAAAWTALFGGARPPFVDEPRVSPQERVAEVLASTRGEQRLRSVRELLLRPLAAAVPCPWPSRPVRAVAFPRSAVALDSEGRVYRCRIDTGGVELVTEGGSCLARVADDVLAVGRRDSGVALFRLDPARLTALDVDDLRGVPRVKPPLVSDRCGFSVSNEARLTVVDARSSAAPLARLRDGAWLSWAPEKALRLHRGGAPEGEVLVDGVDRISLDDARRYAMVAARHRAVVLDLASGRRLVEDLPVEGWGVWMARDGEFAVGWTMRRELRWWRRGEQRWREVRFDNELVFELSARGGRVLAASPAGGLEVLELVSGHRYPLSEDVIASAAFLDGDGDGVVAIDGAGRVWRWSLQAQRARVLSVRHIDRAMWGLALTADGGVASSSGSLDGAGVLVAYPDGRPPHVLPLGPGQGTYALDASDSELIAGSHDGVLRRWRFPGGELLEERDLGVRAWLWSVAAAPRSRSLLVGAGPNAARPRGELHLLDGSTPTEVFGWTGSRNGAGVLHTTWSEDGARAAAATARGYVVLVDVARRDARALGPIAGGEVHRVQFRPGGRELVGVGGDGFVRVWDVGTGELRAQVSIARSGAIFRLDLAGDLALLGTQSGDVLQYDLRRGELTHLYAYKRAYVTALRVDPTYRWFVTADSRGRGCVHRIGEVGCYAELRGHQSAQPIRNAAFLADGQVVTASDDGSVRLWDPPYDASAAELACELRRRTGVAPPDCPERAGASRASR
ncbi:MAG: serine/threonine-protein kinase [Kofleriaceae bacterium]